MVLNAEQPLQIIMRDGLPPAQAIGKPPHPGTAHEVRRENGLRIERNIPVAMRDGIRILVDVYRPDGYAGEKPLPLLIGWSPYGKHNQKANLWPAADVRDGWITKYTAFEAPDPAYWCPRGFAILYPDPRGTWFSEGEMSHGGSIESRDCYDLIEWAGTQDWCNGKVGMSGVSYLTAIQWQVAPLKPPHLAAINPWEGFSDWYREFGYHGGIRETRFIPRSCGGLNWSTTRTEDTLANMLAHPLYDAYWQSKEQDLEAIETPAFIVASWSDQGLHTRGTLEAYKRIHSREKWLEVHGQKKWHYYYRPENVEKQRAFFEHFLIRKDLTVPAWPRVNLEIRERCGVGSFRAEWEWPLARTGYTRLYLDARDRSLQTAPVTTEASLQYDTDRPEEQAEFTHVFTKDTELTGHMKLRLWVETPVTTDMDLFVAIQKYDAAGQYVPFTWYAMCEDGPVALGWLRASHRALDAARSTDWQPVHAHTREDPLQPGVPVAVNIEIWPSATLFRKGEQLRVVIKGGDIYTEAPETQPFLRHEETRNRGPHIIRTGGCYDSYLLVPVIPLRGEEDRP
jgi:predicted acyl esterase